MKELEVKEQKNSRAGIAAALTCNTIYGLSFLFSKVALENTSASMMLVMRFGLALLVMTLLVLFRVSKLDLRGKPVMKLLMLGLCQPVIYFVFETYGIKYSNASFSGMMIALIPVLSTIISAIFLKEELKRSKLLWIFGSVVGVGIISWTATSSGAIQPLGVILMMGAVTIASIFGVLSRSLADQFTSFERTFVMMVLGFIAFLIMAVFQEGSGIGHELVLGIHNKNVLIPILFLSIMSSVVAFFTQNMALSKLSVQRATVFANMSPIISVAAGVLVLGEPFSITQLVGIALIMLSIYMVNRK